MADSKPTGKAEKHDAADADTTKKANGDADAVAKAKAEADEKFRCGTLHYTKASLFFLFSWLIWGNLCFNLFESAGGPGILGLYLQDNFHVSNLQVSILFNFIPLIIGTVMTPIISFKSDRTRSRLGRRIPYILYTAPFLVFFAASLGFSDDIIAYCKGAFTEDSFVSPFTAALIVIGFLTVGFSFFNEFVGTVYYYLCPDVMPRHFMGRFQGVSSVVGTGMGILINIYIVPHQLTHIKAIHVGVAILYLVGFSLMCWRVKEGKYPPVADVTGKTKFRDQVKIYFRECFTHPIFILFYLSMAATALTRGLNPSGVFGLHLSQHLSRIQAHASRTDPVAMTPGGDWLVSGGEDGTIKIWQRMEKTLKLSKIIDRRGDSIRCVAIAPAGDLVAVGTGGGSAESSGGVVEVWDVGKGERVQSIQACTGAVVDIAFPAGGALLASAGVDKTIKIWNAASGACVKTLTSQDEVTTLAMTPDGRWLVSSGGKKSVQYWDATRGDVSRTFRGAGGVVQHLSISTDGKTVASSAAVGPIEIRTLGDGDQLKTLKCEDEIQALALSTNAQKVSVCTALRVRNWDIATTKSQDAFAVQTASICAAMTLDGKELVSGGKDGLIKLWNSGNAKGLQLLKTLKSEGGPVFTVAVSPDGKVTATGSQGGTIEIWDIASGRCLQRFVGHKGSVHSVALSPDGTRLASGSADKTVKIWDVKAGTCLHTLTGHEDEVNSVAFSTDASRVVSGGSDKRIVVWDAVQGKAVKTLEGKDCPGPVYAVCFAPALAPVPKHELPDRGVLKGTLDKVVFFLRQVFTNESLYDTPPDQTSKVLGQDLWVISGGRDGAKDDEYSSVRIWDVAEGKLLKALKGHKQAISTVIYKPDLHVILSGSPDGSIRLWKPMNISETATDQSFKTFSGYTRGVTSLACQSAGVLMVNASSNGKLHMWDIDRGISLAKGGIQGIFFSIIGLLLAYPLGALVDRWNPLKIVLWTSVVTLCFPIFYYFWYHDYVFGLWANLARTPFTTIAAFANMPMLILLYPRAKYGQFCSAAALVRQFVGAIAGIGGAILMDYLTDKSMDTDAFRYGFLFQFSASALSLMALFGVYYQWKKLGGDKYVAPEADDSAPAGGKGAHAELA